jgi:hypothetical protein
LEHIHKQFLVFSWSRLERLPPLHKRRVISAVAGFQRYAGSIRAIDLDPPLQCNLQVSGSTVPAITFAGAQKNISTKETNCLHFYWQTDVVPQMSILFIADSQKMIFSQNSKRSENDNLTIFWKIPKTGHKPLCEHLNPKLFLRKVP